MLKGLGKDYSAESDEHKTGLQDSGHNTKTVRFPEAFRQYSRSYALIFGWSYVEPEVGFSDPNGFIPNKDVL